MNTSSESDLVSDDWLEDAESPLAVDQALKPAFRELALLFACNQIAKSRQLSIREQLHLWRPFDV